MVEEVKELASETKPGLFGQLKLPLERDISFHPSAPMYVTDRLWLLPTDCSSAAFHWYVRGSFKHPFGPCVCLAWTV